MSPETKEKQDHLDALRAFMTSSVHENFVKARTAELANVKDQILMLRPDCEANVALSLQKFGELDVLEEMITTFNDAALSLKARIDEMVERENQQGSTTKV